MTTAGPAVSFACDAGQREDAGADHDADAEPDQVPGAQVLAQPARPRRRPLAVGVLADVLDGLGPEQVHRGNARLTDAVPRGRRPRCGRDTVSRRPPRGQGRRGTDADADGRHTMAIATINPATGETLKTYEPLSDEALEDKLARAAAAWAELPADDAGAAGRLAAGRRRRAGRGHRHRRRAHDHRDGQDARVGQGRGRASAPRRCAGTPSTARRCCEPRAVRRRRGRAPRRPTSSTSRSASCWRSCRGTSRSGRRCGSPPRR